MIHKFQILCPSKKCNKCQKTLEVVEKIISQLKIEAEIEIITEIEKMQNFETWIIPSLFLDGKILTRGYFPKKQDVQLILNKNK